MIQAIRSAFILILFGSINEKKSLIIGFVFLLLFPINIGAYEITGKKWIGANTDFYVDITGYSPMGFSWDIAFKSALGEWTDKTVFDFNLVEEYKDPCIEDRFSSIRFKTDACGDEFGKSTLALTLMRLEPQILGPPAIIEADIIVNSSMQFEIYDGNLFQTGIPSNNLDFRRTILHELGHVVGLGHEGSLPAIMQPNIGNLFRLQQDDILAVKTLYSGVNNCLINRLKFGRSRNELAENDCSVRELAVGGDDESRLDLYSFSLTQKTQATFSAYSNELEAVLIIADENLNYLAYDADVKDDCNASLSTELTSGNYFLIVNTYNVQMKPACGTLGPYELLAGYSSIEATDLGKNISLKGGVSNAIFTGGITATEGQKFGNIFKATDSIDISAEISIDLNHQGRPGFIVVAAVIGEQILLLDEKGDFIDTKTRPGIIFPAIRKTLESKEQVEIIKNLVPAELGINEITVDFIVGYGLDDEADEIFYHENPLNLTIQ